jgi:hypothetical protein
MFLQGTHSLREVYLAFPGLILPQEQVDFRDVPAGHPLIEELVWLVEDRLLYLVHHVAVLADYLIVKTHG